MITEIKCADSDASITMLGTGNALVTKCFNTCFVLKTPQTLFMVDSGGGNGILSQLEKAGIAVSSIQNMFITHAHTDHIMGAIWLMRKVINMVKDGGCQKPLSIYGHGRVLHVLGAMAELMLSKKDYSFVGRQVLFREVRDGEALQLGDLQLQFFDIHSDKEKQYGFRALLPSGKVLTCLGDEPYQESCRRYAENADWLMCESFCLYADRDRFHPYEKYHSTVKDAAQLAQSLNVGNLLLYHTEDATLAKRRGAYTAEARQYFDGGIVVPDDLDVVKIS
ncbi:MAG: MBL fold metallo-hydrolase [Bacteroidaceae bacterium]|nr:MBL fold metallo-hydrolase [Prevotellaceae bacterium]MDY2849280.1 MBL fold metallo-hydrolase [Bacteroidaceae bacterium]